MTDIEYVRSPARELVQRPSTRAFHPKGARRSRTREYGVHFISWIKWWGYLMLFSAFIWIALEVVQYLREMGVK
jgi:hypothetical protein